MGILLTKGILLFGGVYEESPTVVNPVGLQSEHRAHATLYYETAFGGSFS